MKSVKKIVLAISVALVTLMLVSCGKDDQADIQNQPQQPYNYVGSNVGSGYGYDCREMTGTFTQFSPFPSQQGADYPTAGQFLGGNPYAVVKYYDPRLGERCVYGYQLEEMYRRYSYNRGGGYPYNQNQNSWNNFGSSPFASVDLYTPNFQMGGSFNQNFSSSANWSNMGNLFGGGMGGGGFYPWLNNKDQWYLDVNFSFPR